MVKAVGSQYRYNPLGLEFAGNWWSHGRILGHQGMYTEPDDKHIDVLILWGSNAYVSHQIQHARPTIRAMSESTDKMVISVDPRLSETARMADLHIMLRPGSDALFLRGLISLIVARKWQDQAYLDTWCSDWPRAKTWFENFDYENAFSVCRVPMAQAEKFARILTTKTWGVHQDLGIFCGRHNTLNSYLLLTLMAVTGNLEIKGNRSLDAWSWKGPAGDERDENIWRTVETGRFPVCGVYPTGVMAKEILSDREDRLRILFTSMANPARSWPDSQEMAKALERLELHVVIDIVMTETAEKADYVLPGKTGFEAYQWSTFQVTTPEIGCFMKHPVIEQIGERKENGRIWMDIMRAMGYVPEMDKKMYQKAADSVKQKNSAFFMASFLGYMKKHLDQKDCATLMLVDALSRPEALGSVSRAFLRAALATSPISDRGIVERAGFGPSGICKFLGKFGKTKKLAQLSTMDNVFWAADENPSGVICGYANPDPVEFAREHIFYPDHKIRLYDDTVNAHIGDITPDKESALLDSEEKYPMVLSAGNHADGGDNTSMRNPDTYQYRKPFTILVNPQDAFLLKIIDGEEVLLSTRAGSITAPVEYSFKARRGCCLIPHQYGLKSGRGTYGSGANMLTRSEDIDIITGNPFIRFVPCRIDKMNSQTAANAR